MWNKTEIKYGRRCSREITVILFQCYFSFISCCTSRFRHITSANCRHIAEGNIYDDLQPFLGLPK